MEKRNLVTNKNNLIAFGKNTVENLLNSEFFSIKKVFISEEKQKQYKKIISLLEKKRVEYKILSRFDFQKHIPDKKNQGIIVFLKDYNYFTIEEIVEKFFHKKNCFFIILDCIEDPHNFGSILRTCAAFEIDSVIISSKNQVQVNNTVLKVSTGGISYVPICRVKNLEDSIDFLKSKGYLILSTFCDESPYSAKSNFDFLSLQKKEVQKCLILGNEHDGVKNRIMKKSDFKISLPLANNMNSLNVSVICAILVYLLKIGL